ncbi:hypothetical protein P7D66_16745 [Enterococcus avium]|uniref:hypothetical protein n=1 Tax=Enterococcus avium TaxID=33945 RepID=UPI002890EBB2|nr:hypothetical protein [Enterococcus avium]MDT2424034.1 hypothetical protein [Enterococcus avium]
MRKSSFSLLMALVCIIGTLSFPVYSFASDSGATAGGVAKDATATEWNKLSNSLSQVLVPQNEGEVVNINYPTNFETQCTNWEMNEYNFTGPAKRIITKITSSDPYTVAPTYTDHSIQLKRGKGNSQQVRIDVEYDLEWSFRVEEKVAGVWYRVNDRIGSVPQVDSFLVNVSSKKLNIVPKKNNTIELNLFNPTDSSVMSNVNVLYQYGQVNWYMKTKPDDTKLGKTIGTFAFSDSRDTILVDIPFTVVDTTPPSGTLINPIELELGQTADISNFFVSPPKDNGKQSVTIRPDSDPNSLGLGSHNFGVKLIDNLGNTASLSTTVIVKDTTPPKVISKDATIDYGGTVTEADFIDHVSDNGINGPFSFSFDKSKPTPDNKKVGIQDVYLEVSDPSGNITKVQAKLTVNPDTVAPTGNGNLQMIPVNGSISANPLDVVTNLQDNDAISKITAKYIKIPDTSKIGLTDAKVELSDQNGNKSEVTVPVFVHDHHSIFDDQYVLSSQNFTVYSNQVPASKMEEWILQESQSKAWELSSGNEISQQIKVIKHDVKPQFGSYTATIQLGNLTKDLTINILDAKDLIDVTIPQKVIFGSTDVQNGKVSSPSYEVKNNSTAKLKVSLDKMQVDSSSTIDVIRANDIEPSGKDEKVKLSLSSLEEFQFPMIELHPSVANQELGILNSQAVGGFQIKGAYYGKYQNTKCNIQMTF